MRKMIWEPGNMLYPLPAVMVSVGNAKGEKNIITVAWTGTVCSDPAMLYVSVRPERFSHHIIEESREFVVNLTTEELTRATDWCGVRSGKDFDKWKEMKLTPEKASKLKYVPVIKESPVNIECRVTEIMRLGTHDMFLAEVRAVQVDQAYMDQSGKFHLNDTGLVAYSHGEYFTLGDSIGKFGYSVKKK